MLVLTAAGADFRSNWRRAPLGPEFQAVPAQAWEIRAGRLECTGDEGDRSVSLLTRELTDGRGTLRMTVRIGRLNSTLDSKKGWVGFRLGLRPDQPAGLNVGLTSDGRLFIGAVEQGTPSLGVPLDNLKLSVVWEQGWLSIEVDQTKVSKNLPRSDTKGGIALVCGPGGDSFWFRDWRLSGSRLVDRPPVLTNSERPPR
jgi:hypothetical protein